MEMPKEFAGIFRGADLTEDEIRTLNWITGWEHQTVENLRSAVQKAQGAALSTLQAENEKLRTDLEYEREHMNAYYEECGQWEAENAQLRKELEWKDKVIQLAQREERKAKAELEQVKRERDASQSLLAERTGVMGAEPITTAFGLALDRLRELAQAELEQVKADRSRALDDVPDPIAADERQTSPGRQWDWLLRRFTRREQDG